MKKHTIATCVIALGILLSAPIFSETAQKNESAAVESDKAQISESFGHLIGKNIENIGFEFDFDAMVKGLQDYHAGKTAPLNEMQCIAAITAAQEKAFNDLAAKNLAEANQFMEKNEKADKVAILEKGKLHYTINSEGNGAIVEEHFTPVVRYTGKFIDGSLLASSNQDEKITLDETIPGIKQGMIGMKEGEKRTLYIHPDLAYGTSDVLPPNSLLTFEIEVIKANSPKDSNDELSLEDAQILSGDDHLTEMPSMSSEDALR